MPIMKPSRRTFLKASPLVVLAPSLARGASAQTAPSPSVSPADPQAQALGYVDDASQVNRAQYPQYAQGQHCSVCELYQGPAQSAEGPCQIFGGKLVAARGWCSSWTRKS